MWEVSSLAGGVAVILRLVVDCEFVDDFSVPEWTGTALRGVFGYVLRRISCGFPRRSCDGCGVRGGCLYYLTFETRPDVKADARIGRGLRDITRPFTLDPIEMLNRRRFRFALNLIGDVALRHEAIYIFTLVEMGKLGIGRDRAKNERRRFKILTVRVVNDIRGVEETICNGREYVYREKRGAVISLDDIRGVAERVAAAEPRFIIVNFETPTRLVHNGRAADFDFHVLIRNLARRYSITAEYHVDEWQPLSPEKAKSIIEAASLIETSHLSLQPTFSSKFSIERLRWEHYGPFHSGTATYRIPSRFWRHEDAVEALTLLTLGRYMHVGKLATAGYGKIDFSLKIV